MSDLVSIIVPIYNVAPYLDRCLNSLVRQTYQNIEIILVDDGSTDGSGEICDAWQHKDNRIRVFHKANGGMSDARNYGLKRATGDYIGFIDSDDWYDLSFIEVMLNTLVDTDSDVIECDYLSTYEMEPFQTERQTRYEYQLFTGRDCFYRYLTNVFFVSVCNKLYRRALLDKQQFQEGVFHEDEAWTYKIFSDAQRACRLKYTGYYYYQREGSVVHTKPTQKRLTDAFNAGKERIDFIETYYPEYEAIGYSKMMYTCMYLFNVVGSSDIPQKLAMQEELRSYFRILFKKYLRKRQYQKEMWRFCFFRLFPNRYCSLFY